MAQASNLQQISPDRISANPDNPRLVFREEEMTQLLDSIREVGIRVPVSLFENGNRFVLIDGERRWRCAKRLNLSQIPAIIQPKPTKLENLLMMFNIHNVRVDWDPLPMALKLNEVKNLLEKEGQPTNAKALAGVTGVPISSVRRALDLLDLPQKYQNMLLKEAEKPRAEQKIKADLFIEIYKSLHAIERHAPEVLESITKPKFIDSMVTKYRDGVIDNVVGFREVSKIARAELAGASRQDAIPALIKLVRQDDYTIKDAFDATVGAAYERRDLLTKLQGIRDRLMTVRHKSKLTEDILDVLGEIRSEIDRILES